LTTCHFWDCTGRCSVAFYALLGPYQKMWVCIFVTSVIVPEGVVLRVWNFGDCTRRCGFAYLVLLGLYQKVWCCVFCTSGTVSEDELLPIWDFWDCTRKSCVAYSILLGLFQNVWFTYLFLLGLYQKVWFCLFGTLWTVLEHVLLSIWYFLNCTRRCGVAYFAYTVHKSYGTAACQDINRTRRSRICVVYVVITEGVQKPFLSVQQYAF